MKRILSFFLTLVLTAALLCPAALADSGAVNEKYGYQEADLVLKIGLYLKEELETYRNVHVDMTRSDSYGTRYTPLREVKQRVDFAAEKCSDLLVSLHLNSAGSNQSVHGGLILASNGNYDPDCAKVIDAVGSAGSASTRAAASSKRARTTVRPIPTASSPTITASSATASSGTSRP